MILRFFEKRDEITFLLFVALWHNGCFYMVKSLHDARVTFLNNN